jgi:omega-6 fatty acid desaturase (delta-12 desaturase)
MERDEVYVPKTRSDLGIPKEDKHHEVHYEDYFMDTPIYTLGMLILQQLIAFPAYLCKSFSVWLEP